MEEVQNLDSSKLQGLLDDFEDGKVKIYAINKALDTRHKNLDLFQNGAYVSLEVKGPFSNNVIAFCRKTKASCAVIVVPRLMAKLTNMERLPLGDVWGDTFVCLPLGVSKIWRENFTNQSVVSKKLGGDGGFYVGDLLHT